MNVADIARTAAEFETGTDNPRLLRKCFAARVMEAPLRALIFAAFDGRLDVAVVRQVARTAEEAREAVALIR